jgi:DNA-binding Xre family transcriptional regulator
MRRKLGYRWLLRDVMAGHGMYATTALVPLLADRGIDLSPSQVHRLVTQTPERLSLHVLAALCDIFACTPADLVVIDAEVIPEAKAANADRTVVDMAKVGRPRRPRVRPDD